MTHVRGTTAEIANSFQSRDAVGTDGTHSLRVALFSGNYNYVRDGANRTLNRLVGYLESMGVPVRVYAPTVSQPAFPPVGDLISVPSIAIPRRTEYRLGLGLPERVLADLEAFAPTLIHLSSPDLIGLAAQRFAHRARVPMVASYHTRFESYLRYYGLDCLRPLAVRYLRTFYSRCRHLYAPTAGLAQELHRDGYNDDVRVWSRGIDRQQFSPAHRDPAWRASLGAQQDEMLIAFVGRIVREKGLDLLARTAEGLNALQVRYRLMIVGDGPERRWLESRMPQAIFTGHLDGAALARAYASADVFLNPSTTESFGNVTLEAMASGLPTVCAQATGSQTLVREGATGFLVDPTCASAFVAAIARLAISPALRVEMGRAGRRDTQAYSWDSVMAGLLANYHDALAPSALAAATRALAEPNRAAIELVREGQS